MAAPQVHLQPLPLFDIASFHQAAGRKHLPDTTIGFIIGAREVQDVTIFASCPVQLDEHAAFDSEAANNLTIERLRLTLKVKSMFQGRRREPQVVGWYCCGASVAAAALANLQRMLWPLAQTAVVFPEPDDDNEHITHFRDLRVSCAAADAAICLCVDSSNHYAPSAVLLSQTGNTTPLTLQHKHVHQETAVIREPSLKTSDPLPSHLALLSDSIHVLAQKVAHITQQLDQQITCAAPCSRSLRRRAASILQHIQRLQAMNMLQQLQGVTANVDAARTLQALFGSTAQLQRLMIATNSRSGQ